PRDLPSFPTRRSSDLRMIRGFALPLQAEPCLRERAPPRRAKRVAAGCEPIDVSSCLTGGTPMKLRLFSLALLACGPAAAQAPSRSEEHTSELQSRENL